MCLVAVLAKISASPQFVFNDGRLAPVFSILLGNPPLYSSGHGPLLNTVYGPLSYFYYFPCGLFSHHISLAILSGSLLSMLAFLIPISAILYRERARLRGVQMLWLGTLGLSQTLVYAGLACSAFMVHADAPATLLSSLCVLTLAWRDDGIPASVRTLWLSATFGVLTIWCKQTYAAVVFLPLIVALLGNYSWKQRIALAGWIGLLNGILLLFFSMWCGIDALFENLLKIPGAIPSSQVSFLYGPDVHAPGGLRGHLRSLVVSAHIMIGKYLTPYLLCFFVYLFIRIKNQGRPAAANLAFRVSRLSGLFFLAALLNLPLAAETVIKVAGGPAANDDNPFCWFFILGAFCLMIEKRESMPATNAWFGNRVVYAVFAAISLTSLIATAGRLPANLKTISHTFANDEATVAAACSQSPGKYYFPWNPAAVYAAERKFYHWQYIAEFRASVGFGPTRDYVNQYLPPAASVIGLPLEYSAAGTNYLSQYLQNIQPCDGPAVAGAGRFAWFSFERKP